MGKFLSLLNLQIRKFENRDFPFKMILKQLLYDFLLPNVAKWNPRFNVPLKEFYKKKKKKPTCSKSWKFNSKVATGVGQQPGLQADLSYHGVVAEAN